MNLIAKPVIKDQYWVITDGTTKVGNVIANHNGYDVKVNGDNLHFTSTKDISTKIKIDFQGDFTRTEQPRLMPEYPTPPVIYNSVMDVKRKLHVFTTDTKSKCYQVAGWFVLDHNDTKQVVFCPKYIYVQRYPYSGPYKTKEEADAQLNIQV